MLFLGSKEDWVIDDRSYSIFIGRNFGRNGRKKEIVIEFGFLIWIFKVCFFFKYVKLVIFELNLWNVVFFLIVDFEIYSVCFFCSFRNVSIK